MPLSLQLILIVLTALYCAGPVAAVWGWIRFFRRPRARGFLHAASVTGMGLSAASLLLAAALVYEYTIGFADFALALQLIFAIGLLLFSLAVLASLIGLFRRSGIRWLALLSGFGALAFWFISGFTYYSQQIPLTRGRPDFAPGAGYRRGVSSPLPLRPAPVANLRRILEMHVGVIREVANSGFVFRAQLRAPEARGRGAPQRRGSARAGGAAARGNGHPLGRTLLSNPEGRAYLIVVKN